VLLDLSTDSGEAGEAAGGGGGGAEQHWLVLIQC